jgi:hypothetical protein
MRLRLALGLGAAILAGTVAVGAVPANAAVGATPANARSSAQAGGLESTIALNNCSASLVRYPTSHDTDRALMLTNGHCYEGGMPSAGQVLQNRSSSRSGKLLDSSGNTLGTVRADTLLYATMTNTDVALYRLTDTFATIKSRYGATALTISGSHPADGASMTIPSSYWKRVWNCQVNGFVGTLREAGWTFHDSIRYRSGCTTTHGSSGSPIIDSASGQVIGINNTGNDAGAMCTLNNPCEVDANGNTTATKGQSYGQETYWFTTCLAADNTINLSASGCLLTKPGGTGGGSCSGQKLANPGFESGATSWTAGSGVIGQHGAQGEPTHSGTWNARLDGRGSSRTDTLSQSVSIPAGCHATLTFWLHIDTSETTSGTAYDRLTVQAGSIALATYSNLNAATGYTQRTLDVSSLAGQTTTVTFTGTEDSSLQTSFVIDDTALTLS